MEELMYLCGQRDGLEGLNPSSTSVDYLKGYWEGRRERLERKMRYDWLDDNSDKV